MMNYDKPDLTGVFGYPKLVYFMPSPPYFQGFALDDEGNISLATVSPHTEPAPAALRAIAQASRVAPVVQTSSMSNILSPCSSCGQAKASRTLLRRSAALAVLA
jgi:hypothetical protein